ncbi:MAG: hypothetical protein II664_01005, partial [Oscillospiraceae bacterium]|nr:hypothetical protein [Oscillospiraceae bacterium]
MNSLTSEQKKLLGILLTKYENSKTCFGENKIGQHFRCKPDEAFPEYSTDYIDIDLKAQYDCEIRELETSGFITAERNSGDVVSTVMINNMYNEYCRALGITNRHDKLLSQREVLMRYADRCPVLGKICADQLKRLDANKDNSVSADIGELDKILGCIAFIEDNKTEILERELSIEVFFDSKLFENRYKTKVCGLLMKYESAGIAGDSETNKKLLADMLLSEHGIVRNPTYIYFKGRGKLNYMNGYSISLVPEVPVAINSRTLPDIESLSISDAEVMTVENLTSYNRMQSNDTFLIFLSGYSNKAKDELLRMIFSLNPGKKWFHFGDIDPDGFYILEDLRSKTGIDFMPFRMGIPELEKYGEYTKRLEDNDKRKADTLLQSGYSDII